MLENFTIQFITKLFDVPKEKKTDIFREINLNNAKS